MRSRLAAMACLTLALGAPAAGQGLEATPAEELEGFEVWEPGDLGEGAALRVDLRDTLPEPGEQGGQLSCVAWTVAYAMKSQQEVLDRRWAPDDPARLFSPTFLWNQLNGGVNRGTKLYKALRLLREQGCCTLEDLPYKGWDRAHPRLRITDEHKAKAAPYRITRFARLRSAAQIRAALQLGHVVMVAITTDPIFSRGEYAIFDRELRLKGEDEVERSSRGAHGRHACCLVGYDDSRGAFLLMNSWGKDWGQGGFVWVSYELIDAVPNAAPGARDEFIREAWIAFDEPSGPAATREALRGQSLTRYAGFDDSHPTWMVSLRLEAGEALSAIESVTWRLPEGEAVRAATSTHWRSGFCRSFAASEAGAGEVEGLVIFKDGRLESLKVPYEVRPRAARRLRIAQSDRYEGLSPKTGKPLWRWRLALGGDLVDLSDVRSVSWDLGSSYSKEPIVTTEASDAFAISRLGSRPVPILATLTLKDGSSLKLEAQQEFTSPQLEGLSLGNTSRFLGLREERPTWSWTASLRGPLRALREVREVRYELHRSFREPVRVVTEGAEAGFPLSSSGYGVFTLRAAVTLESGEVLKLEHRLSFVDPNGESANLDAEYRPPAKGE